RGILQQELHRPAGYFEVPRVAAKVIVQIAVDPDATALEPMEFTVIYQGAGMIQATEKSAILMVDAVSFPKGQDHVKQFTLELMEQIPHGYQAGILNLCFHFLLLEVPTQATFFFQGDAPKLGNQHCGEPFFHRGVWSRPGANAFQEVSDV